MNSFLSTSRQRSIALNFARLTPITDGTQRIIFEIEINPRLQTKAFANVTQTSCLENEAEILIMLGALFRIKEIIEDKQDRIWVARVSLASEDDYQLKDMFSYMKKTIGDDADLDSLGKILIEMGEDDQAQKCYRKMLNETKLVLGNAEFGLGRALVYSKKSEESLMHLKEALQIRQLILGQNHADVGECYNYIGVAQWHVQEEYDQVLLNLRKAVEIQESTLPPDSLVLARTYSNLASTYNFMGENDIALNFFNKTLEIQQKVLPHNHPKIASTYNNLGTLFQNKKDYSQAMEYYKKSSDISCKTLPPNHPDLLQTKNNIDELKQIMEK